MTEPKVQGTLDSKARLKKKEGGKKKQKKKKRKNRSNVSGLGVWGAQHTNSVSDKSNLLA